jgi:hypothetical protein
VCVKASGTYSNHWTSKSRRTTLTNTNGTHHEKSHIQFKIFTFMTHDVNKSHRVECEKLIVAQLVRVLLASYGTQSSLPCSQELATRTDEPSIHHIFFYILLSCFVCIGRPCDIFLSDIPTTMFCSYFPMHAIYSVHLNSSDWVTQIMFGDEIIKLVIMYYVQISPRKHPDVCLCLWGFRTT